jgi:hypothetical protein
MFNQVQGLVPQNLRSQFIFYRANRLPATQSPVQMAPTQQQR